jgi:hypothetical protein
MLQNSYDFILKLKLYTKARYKFSVSAVLQRIDMKQNISY